MNKGIETPFIMVRGLSKTYITEGEEVHALRDLRLDVQRGEFLSIIGPSGCGKSTLLYIIGGLAAPTAGTVIIAGREIANLPDSALSHLRGVLTGFVFQKFNLIPTLSIRDNIVLAQGIRGAAQQGIDEILHFVGLAGKGRRKPHELSMGEQQRASIARAVAHRPAILLADEPTGNLDSANSDIIVALLRKMHREYGQTILLVSHNPEIAAAAERTVRMRDGRVI